MKLCGFEGCDKAHSAKGFCKRHYYTEVWSKKEENYLRNRNNMRSLKARNAEFLKSLKESPCVDCGVQYPHYVMQFDHVRGKKSWDVANYGTASTERILEESRKCDLVCANCHAERTHSRREKTRT